MRLFFVPVLLLATPVLANTGFGGFTATGLEFEQTDAVSLIEENLWIGLDLITVDYVFRNVTETDVTGEVIFPLPPVYRPDGYHFPQDNPAPESLVGFALQVDGQKVQANVDTIAVIEPRWADESQSSDFYDVPGRDVTSELKRLEIPLTFDEDAVEAALLELSEEEAWDATGLGLVKYQYSTSGKSEPYSAERRWSLVVRHHWPQTFPAGKDVRVSISYRNVMPGGLFDRNVLREAEYSSEFAKEFCLDSEDFADIAKLMDDDPNQIWLMGMTLFVLRTANSWAGPIGRFQLTIDKGDPINFVATCKDGLIRTSPTTLLWEATDYSPDKDLWILMLNPMTFQPLQEP